MKLKFNSDDDFPFDKNLTSLKVHKFNNHCQSRIEEDSKYCCQIFLDECLYRLQKCCSVKELMYLTELILISQKKQKSV